MANFIKHTNCEKCGSSDGRAVYEDNSSHCFVCEHTVPSNEFKEQNSKKTTNPFPTLSESYSKMRGTRKRRRTPREWLIANLRVRRGLARNRCV